ncbi:MAG TPA: M20/M25/M40 family metallo-hydrolase [Vicinamibacterales bacterium]|nr:M20/M25/M40 family metallo-hydrolase [Vicinamibacterales bacterium]
MRASGRLASYRGLSGGSGQAGFRRHAVVLACLLAICPADAIPAAGQAGSGVREKVSAWVAANQRVVVRTLLELLALPNVASDRAGIRRNADYLRDLLAARGFRGELLETAGNPLVYGELRVPGAARTLLLYSHYDGQPVDPAAWKQEDPFKPVLRTGRLDQGGREVPDVAQLTRFEPDWRIYARSAADDKSPIVAFCAALDALKAAGLSPVSNLRVVLDGEEEAGSPSLVPAIAKYRDRLNADLMIIFDGPMHSTGRPTIVYGARGIVTVNLTVYGPRAGVHSGNYGNWIPNPAQRLASLLASMKDEDGRVLIPGFYDGLVPLAPDERKLLDDVPDDAATMLKAFGVAAPEKAFPRLQDAYQFPTLNIRGLASAHVGAGARTIIPDRATAAIDIRLVKETNAEDLLEKLRAHVRSRGYHVIGGEPDEATRAEHPRIAGIVTAGTATQAFRTPPTDPEVKRLTSALEQAFGAPPVQLRTLGGTVPIAPFIEALGFPAVLVPLVNFDNNQHEENENLRLGHFFQAVEIAAAVIGVEPGGQAGGSAVGDRRRPD